MESDRKFHTVTVILLWTVTIGSHLEQVFCFLQHLFWDKALPFQSFIYSINITFLLGPRHEQWKYNWEQSRLLCLATYPNKRAEIQRTKTSHGNNNAIIINTERFLPARLWYSLKRSSGGNKRSHPLYPQKGTSFYFLPSFSLLWFSYIIPFYSLMFARIFPVISSY